MKHLEWNDYFMKLAKVTAARSKDPNTKVGAILINEDKRIIGTGYNGMPKGIDSFPWGREGNEINTKYPYVIHAELNAILNTTVPTKNSILYVTLFPCSECSKLLAQAGVTKIYYHKDKYKDTENNKIAKKILNLTNVEIEQI